MIITKTTSRLFAVGLLISTAILSSCSSSSDKKKNDTNQVVIHELSDPDMLNPITYQDAGADAVMKNIFQALLNVDYKSLELVPILAQSRPEIIKTPEGGMLITYQIRPEARWDNGTPVTAKDVEFTLKVIKNPRVNNMPKKPYFDFITDIKLYPEDPLKLTFVSNKVYIRAEYTTGAESAIIPEYAYDRNGVLKNISLKQIMDTTNSEVQKTVAAFAQEFNSEKWGREKEYVEGSGAYELVEWKTGQSITLKKKENWWGDKLKDVNMYFEAYPEKLVYQTINDQTTALVALKGGNLDAMYGIKSKDFVGLPESKKFMENFNAMATDYLAYSYIGLNTKNPKFASKKTRQALAHILNVDKIIKTVGYGLSQRVTGPIHPSKKRDYDFDVKPFEYDLEKAKQLLAEDGWKDSNGNGILDKTVNGQNVEFKIDFSYNSGNDERKAAALIFKEDARKVGIEVNVAAQEWSVYLDNQKKHNFEMYYGAWVGEYAPEDPHQLFATESANNGSNYVYFGNSQTDALLDSITVELDDEKRAELYKRFHRILHDDAPYLFIAAPKNKIAISKRFENAYASGMYPGFWPAGFKVASK